MILERFPELMKLTPDEKQQLCSELGGTFFVDEPVTDPGILAVLERRMEEYRRDPGKARPWSEIRVELRAKYLNAPRE